jgi:hypothetical protein
MTSGERLTKVRGMKLFGVWDALFLAIVAAAALLFFIPGLYVRGSYAEVYSDGTLIRVISLEKDGEYHIESNGGTNILTVENGRIRVTESDCPDGLCMDFGWKERNGEQIICLPHRLTVIVTSDLPPDYDVIT